MALSKIKAESLNLAETYAFTGTVTGASEITASTTAPSEGGAATTSVVQGLAKAWTVNANSIAGNVGDSLNNSSFSDVGTGQTQVTLTNPMSAATDWCVTQGVTSGYPYNCAATSSTTHRLNTVSGTGSYADGSSNGQVTGDLA